MPNECLTIRVNSFEYTVCLVSRYCEEWLVKELVRVKPDRARFLGQFLGFVVS